MYVFLDEAELRTGDNFVLGLSDGLRDSGMLVLVLSRDTLPVFLSTVTTDVSKVFVKRHLDASKRRLSLQKKIGAGLSLREFRTLAAKGRLGHRGLKESVSLVGKALGLRITTIKETLRPAIAPKRYRTPFLDVPRGSAAGIINFGYGFRGSVKLIELDLRMYVGCPDPKEEIRLVGKPSIVTVIPGGIHGDTGTVAVLVNTIPHLMKAPPGFLTMEDLVPHFVR